MKTKRVRLAPLIREAANNYLWDGICELYSNKNYRNFSCVAIDLAIQNNNLYHTNVTSKIDEHLKNCGLDETDWKTSTFREFAYGEERQGVRYAWLNLFANYLEEIDARVTVTV